MARADAYVQLLSRATGLAIEDVPADSTAQLAAVQAAQLLEARLQREQRSRSVAKLQRPDFQLVEVLIDAARKHFGLGPWSVSELLTASGELAPSEPARIGQVLRRAEDDAFVHDGHRVECCGSTHGTKQWRVRVVAIHLVRP